MSYLIIKNTLFKDGSYICRCADSYTQLNINNRIKCIDVDECSSNSFNFLCPYPTTCVNTVGSYDCCYQNQVPSNETCFSCGLQYTPPVQKIIGGTVARVNSWPWMVSIGINYKTAYYFPLFDGIAIEWHNISHICGGVLISDDTVLTAAHCIVSEIISGGTKIPLVPNDFHKTHGECIYSLCWNI